MRPKSYSENEARGRLLALDLLRRRKGWNQKQLATALSVAPSTLSAYEDGGGRMVPIGLLRRTAKAAGFPSHLLPHLLSQLRSFVAVSAGWARLERLVTDEQVTELAVLLGEVMAILLPPAGEQARPLMPRAEDRAEAQKLWAALAKRNRRERLALIEEAEEYRSWALAELVARESIDAAARDPREALELAELSLKIAELWPGPEPERWRLMGHAWAHIANAKRVLNDLDAAEKALAEGKLLWEAGASPDARFLNEVWILWIEATIHDARRRFPQALKTVQKALYLDDGCQRGKLLLTKAQIHTAEGDLAASTAALAEAFSFVDGEADPRTAMGVLFQLILNLCHGDKPNEAATYLSALYEAAERLGQEMDSIRVRWLEGVVAGGQGQIEEAVQTLEEVRRDFVARQFPYDYALVSLELSLVLLKIGRPAEVRRVSSDLVGIFRHQGLPENALAALRLFCEAARQEEATIELTERILRFLRRVACDPAAIFTPEG